MNLKIEDIQLFPIGLAIKWDDNTDSRLDLAFNKDQADNRKIWLSGFDCNRVLDLEQSYVTISDFIDKDLIHLVKESLISKGVNVYLNEEVRKVSLKKKLKEISLKNSNIKLNSNEILVAIGREPNISRLNLEELGIKLTKTNAIKVNKNLMTNIKNIFAVGDVTDRMNLTPVAIAEGQFLSEKLFGKSKVKNIDLSYVGTAVFSSPPISSIGPTEKEAKKKYKKIEIYESKFTSLKYSIVNKKIPTYIKLIVNGINKRVVAAHMFGEEGPEIIQLIGVAIEAKATIHNFNNTMAIHPTVAEEFVTFKKPKRIITRL